LCKNEINNKYKHIALFYEKNDIVKTAAKKNSFIIHGEKSELCDGIKEGMMQQRE